MTTTLTTKLVKDGNSIAVRLPKSVLALSGLTDSVQMEVKRGQVILRSTPSPRSGWKKQIAHVAAASPAALLPDQELNDWEVTSNDGLK